MSLYSNYLSLSGNFVNARTGLTPLRMGFLEALHGWGGGIMIPP